MDPKVFRQTEKRVQEIESKTSLENFIIATNFDEKHNMKIGEKNFKFSPAMQKVYQDLNGLELADLWDLKRSRKEYGESF